MSDDSIVINLKYGCPVCSPRKEETGEYHESFSFIEETAFKWKIMRLFGKTPPKQKIKERVPIYRYIFDDKPITIPIKDREPFQFKCPYCGSLGWIKIIHLEKQLLDWRFRHSDGYISRFMVRDCRLCGEKLSVYLRRESQDVDFWGRCMNPKCQKGTGEGA